MKTENNLDSYYSLYLYMFSAIVEEMDKKQPRYQSEIQRKKIVYLNEYEFINKVFALQNYCDKMTVNGNYILHINDINGASSRYINHSRCNITL